MRYQNWERQIDCLGIGHAKCTEPTSAYAAGLLGKKATAQPDTEEAA